MPMIGRDKILEQHKSILRYVPDFCVVYTKIVRSKKRLITIKGNSFGTFPYANAVDKTINSWNIFENASIDRLDEHHKTQKQKYDTLKSQNKIIKFERSVTGYIMLSRDMKRFTKIISCDIKVYVY